MQPSHVVPLLLLCSACPPTAPAIELVGITADCVLTPESSTIEAGLLDVTAADSAFFAYARVTSPTHPLRLITTTEIEVFFDSSSLDVALPGESAPRHGEVSQSAHGPPDGFVFFQLVTQDEASLLRGAAEPVLTQPQDRASVDVTVRVRGQIHTTDENGVPDPTPVTSNLLRLPLALCRGCVVEQCSDDAHGCMISPTQPACRASE